MNDLYKTKQSREIYRGPFFSLREYLVEYPDGGEKKRIILEHPGAVAAVPLLPDGKIVMVRQFRKAAGRVTLEIPAGKIDSGESPEDCIRRELIEETGYRPGRLRHLRSYYPSFGISTEIIHVFLAENLQPTRRTPADESYLEPVILPLEEVKRLITAGKIMDSKTIIGIQELERM
ncbi:MAG: NUDIX hydrolase [Candidatus Euphemobacter frigidus]|nr:NUDIX hydrolase [Candidatus Euphemobacter frigidus]MDP8274857.1 NUDIX hydrolase [Candidatus Euphemobacter frigidus]